MTKGRFVPMEVKMFGVSREYFNPSLIDVVIWKQELGVWRIDIYNGRVWGGCIYCNAEEVKKYIDKYELVEE